MLCGGRGLWRGALGTHRARSLALELASGQRPVCDVPERVIATEWLSLRAQEDETGRLGVKQRGRLGDKAAPSSRCHSACLRAWDGGSQSHERVFALAQRALMVHCLGPLFFSFLWCAMRIATLPSSRSVAVEPGQLPPGRVHLGSRQPPSSLPLRTQQSSPTLCVGDASPATQLSTVASRTARADSELVGSNAETAASIAGSVLRRMSGSATKAPLATLSSKVGLILGACVDHVWSCLDSKRKRSR